MLLKQQDKCVVRVSRLMTLACAVGIAAAGAAFRMSSPEVSGLVWASLRGAVTGAFAPVLYDASVSGFLIWRNGGALSKQHHRRAGRDCSILALNSSGSSAGPRHAWCR